MERPTRAKIESLAAQVVILQGDNEVLRARVARLEEVLREIDDTYKSKFRAGSVGYEMAAKARRALEEK